MAEDLYSDFGTVERHVPALTNFVGKYSANAAKCNDKQAAVHILEIPGIAASTIKLLTGFDKY